MSSVGISTFLADQWLNTLANIPYTAPICAFQLHNGEPGPNGTANVSPAATVREAATFTAAANGTFTFTGTPPIFPIVAPDTITFLSAFDSLTFGSGNFLFSGAVLAPRIVAIGDQLGLSGFALSFVTLAS